MSYDGKARSKGDEVRKAQIRAADLVQCWYQLPAVEMTRDLIRRVFSQKPRTAFEHSRHLVLKYLVPSG